jgi:hypothetical protein
VLEEFFDDIFIFTVGEDSFFGAFLAKYSGYLLVSLRIGDAVYSLSCLAYNRLTRSVDFIDSVKKDMEWLIDGECDPCGEDDASEEDEEFHGKRESYKYR